MKLENGQNLQDHLKVFVEFFEELAIIGDAMKEEERVIIQLSSLPDRFSTLVTALEAHEKIPEWEVVTERLLNEKRRQRGGPGTSDSSEKLLVSFKRNKKLIKCFECGKEGHIKRQCRVYEKRLKKENRTFQANKAVDARSSSTGETIMFTSALSIGAFKRNSVLLAPFLKKKNMRNQKESWSSVVQLGTELLLIDLENGCALHKINLMFLEQSAYTKALLSRFGMDKANSVATPVDVNVDLVTTSDEVEECDKDLHQSAVGTLLYLSTRTRPDITFAVNNVAEYCSKPLKKHWTGVKIGLVTEVIESRSRGLSAEKFSRLRRNLGVVFFEKHIQCEKEC
ncbi:Zinc finger CCHC-type [Trinorchestia longiramus]|nr:Zinc finger CCHC-type [Trinorchestia longiramus]